MTNSWRNTTHDWAGTVDTGHLDGIRRDPSRFVPDVAHLILEVLAYAADEAEVTGAGRCAVTPHADGSVSVADNGRGTDTRYDDQGRPVRKPVMATKDLRFFDQPDAPLLPDGHPRRGMSVVAALSAWLLHTNRRRDGAWTQRYEHGLPVTDLVPIQSDDSTGTTVRFLPDAVPGTPGFSASGSDFAPGPATPPGTPRLSELTRLAGTAWPHLTVEVVAEPSPED